MTRVLLVEDSDPLRRALRTSFAARGLEVVECPTGSGGVVAAADGGIDVVVLDLGLPDLDGMEVLARIRSFSDVPVIVLSARDDRADKIGALDGGADDYVTKPFGTLELIARVHALLRRASRRDGPPPPSVERFGEIEINPASRTAYRAGREVSLTPREFDLLLALLRRNGAVGSRADLLREVWEYGADVMSRTVDIHIAELRRKLEIDPANPRHILTVWKVGYRLER